MAGSKEGARKRRETMIAKFGSEEAYLLYMKRNASRGGVNGGRGGFAMMSEEELRKVSARGGRAPRRKKSDERPE